jgi:protein SCO1
MRITISRYLGLLAFALAISACPVAWSKAPDQGSPAASNAAAVKAGEVGVDEKLGKQVPLDVVLRDEDGHPVTLGTLIDRPTLLTLNYFSCAGICTPQLNALADTVNRTHAEIGKNYRIITVSFDDRDKPDVAAKKRSNYIRQIKRPVSPDDWHFLTGDAASTRRVADAVGYKFKKVGDTFVHPSALMVLSPKGVITRYLYGITYVPGDIEMAVDEAAKGQVQPTVSRLARFCFSYDPAGHRYTLNVTRIVGTVVLATATIFAAFLIFTGQRPKQKDKKTT